MARNSKQPDMAAAVRAHMDERTRTPPDPGPDPEPRDAEPAAVAAREPGSQPPSSAAAQAPAALDREAPAEPAISPDDAAHAPHEPAAGATAASPARPRLRRTKANDGPTRQIGAHFPVDVHRQARSLAAELDLTMQTLLGDALNDYFAKHNRPRIAPGSADSLE